MRPPPLGGASSPPLRLQDQNSPVRRSTREVLAMPAKHLERLVASARGVEAAPTMDCRQGRRSRLISMPLTLTSALTAVALLVSSSSASAAEDDAMMILKRMSDYVSAQKAISLSYD